MVVFNQPTPEEQTRYKELREGQVTNAIKSKQKNVKPPTKEEGVTWLTSAGTTYTQPEITAEIIRDMYDNIYVRKVIEDQRNITFQEEFSIEAKDAKGKIDVEVSDNLLRMCQEPDNAVWDMMNIALTEHFLYGLPIFNPIWGQGVNLKGQNEFRLIKLTHLPSYSFRTLPSGKIMYSNIMQGVTVNDAGEIEYWQEPGQGKPPVQLTNVFSCKKPTDLGVAGDPIIVPLVGIIGMVQFLWNTVMVQANRIGSKILFIKLTNPKSAMPSNGNLSDLDYTLEVLKTWKSGVAFVLRESMEIIEFNQRDDSNSLETLKVLKGLIRDYVTPVTLLGNEEGARLGGGDTSARELLDNKVISIHNWLAKSFKHPILTNYFLFNKYEGYTAEFKIPKPMHDTREIDMKRATVSFLTQSGKQNEIRGLLGQNALTDPELAIAKVYYDSLSKTETLIAPPR